MRNWLLFVPLAVLSLPSFTGAAEKVVLRWEGIHCPTCGGKVAAALSEVPGAKVLSKPSPRKPEMTVEFDPAKADLGELAKTGAEAQTPEKDKGSPSATLVLSAPSLTKDNAEKIHDALKDVKGIVAAGSKSAADKMEIHVKLDDKGGAKWADIQKALAEFLKKPEPKKPEK